jgi:hypothetical protein
MGATLDAIAFGAFEGPLGPALEGAGGARFHLAGRIETHDWNGRRSVQLAPRGRGAGAPRMRARGPKNPLALAGCII